MKRRLIVRALATADTLDIAAYIGANSPQAAERFLRAAQASFQDLAETPGIGAPVKRRRLPECRKWAIHGFLNYIIYYRVREDAVVIVAVFHGARNIYRALRDRLQQEG